MRNGTIGAAINSGFHEEDLISGEQARDNRATPAKHYSFAEELAAKRIERSKPKDILEVLADPRLQAENHSRHQDAATSALQESWRIEKQLAAEKAAGAKL
jgi:hypothetical protein